MLRGIRVDVSIPAIYMRSFFGVRWRRNGLVNGDIGLRWDMSARRNQQESGMV